MRSVAIGVLVTLVAVSLFGQSYDTKTVQTVSGTIVSIDQPTTVLLFRGIHITLQTGSDVLDVQLGPAFNVERLLTLIAPGDRIEVKGSLVRVGDHDLLIAAEVSSATGTVKLRHADDGIPISGSERYGARP